MKLYFQREDANHTVIKCIHFGELHPPARHNASSQPQYYTSRERVSLLSETLSAHPMAQKGLRLPFSQWLPVNPEGHTHLLGATHVPPYLHPSSQNAVAKE